MGPQSNTPRSFKADWAAVVVSFIALLISIFGIVQSRQAQRQTTSIQRQQNDLAQQANKISQANQDLQKKLQAQSLSGAQRDRASQISVFPKPSGDLVVRNSSPYKLSDTAVVFQKDYVPAISPSETSERGYLYLWVVPACTQEVVPGTVTLPGGQQVSTPDSSYAVLYFVDGGKYWATDETGVLYALSGVQAPNLPYSNPGPDLGNSFSSYIKETNLPSCGGG